MSHEAAAAMVEAPSALASRKRRHLSGDQESELVSTSFIITLNLLNFKHVGYLLMKWSADLGRHTQAVLVQILKTPKQELPYSIGIR